jgi:LPS export ABC transporter permease LptG/LPS export ABC transporter permease LptF
MRKIDKLVLLAVIPPIILAGMILTFVVLTREIGVLSELLITRNASLEVVGLLVGAILPGILIFSLPMSYLIGILIGLSGLSGENQITVLRACGVPLRRILLPILILGSLVMLITGYLSLVILPSSTDLLHSLKDSISVRQATSQLQPRVFYEQFPDVVFYLDDLASDKQKWSRVFLVDNSNAKSPRVVLARDGVWVSEPQTLRLQFHLEKGTIYEVNPDDPGKDNVSVFATTDIPLELNHGGSPLPGGGDASRPKKPSEQSTWALWRGTSSASPEERREQLVELHKRLALPFSVLGFSLVGLTLGISTKKGGRSSGMVLSFVFVLLFYTLFTGGIRLASVGKLPPWLGAWGANLTLVGLGLVLLATAERSHWLAHWISGWQWKDKLVPLGRQLHLDAARTGIHRLDNVFDSSKSTIARFRFPKVLDVYISKGFCTYFFWALMVCTALFVILTLFDLLDDIIRNRIPLIHVIGYFVFLTPQILLLVIPMSVLVAVLINFGILEKSSEITALKAGGWSLYRISLPVFVLAAVFCLGIYLMQDYVLPYANIQQDSLRNTIKGKPAQTSQRPQRKWILGESNRIYNYDYFDPGQKIFVGLNIFEVDLAKQKILRRIHAARGWIYDEGDWTLENGWVRDFQSQQKAFRSITKEDFAFPEKISYFEKEIFEPKESSKLSYLELKDYISYLQKSGYNAAELQVELYKKISFPVSCVVMALLGVPFSFSMGRKGAFFGITASVVIAIAYWGIFSAFEQLGSYGLLIPMLAAWAPNMIFGAAGLALLLTIRT